jgi:hypothetical protein
MNNSVRLAVLSATAALLPNVASAGTQLADTLAAASPVQVTACSVNSATLSRDVDQPSETVAGRLWLRFKNRSQQPATEVTLRVKYGADVETLVERGVFSTGVRVERASDLLAFAPWTGAAPDCTVVSMKFADGTAWLPASNLPRGSG